MHGAAPPEGPDPSIVSVGSRAHQLTTREALFLSFASRLQTALGEFTKRISNKCPRRSTEFFAIKYISELFYVEKKSIENV